MSHVFLFSAKTRIYKQNTHTHKVELKTLYLKFVWLLQKPFSPFYLKETTNYWGLSVSRTVSQLFMRLNKPTVEYKVVQLCSIIIEIHTKENN